MVKGVIFDMDGTMFDTEPISAAGWKKAGKQKGIEISDELIESFCGSNPERIEKLFREQYGAREDFDEIARIRREHCLRVIEEEGVPIKKGLPELLAFLKAQGIPAAVATSTERARAEGMLMSAGVYDYFAGCVYGDADLPGKPKPDIFLKAAEKIGQRPEDCAVLEDSVAGLMAGKAAGGYVFYIPDIAKVPEEVREGITAQFENLLQVIDWIREENKLQEEEGISDV